MTNEGSPAPQRPQNRTNQIPASAILEELQSRAPANRLTLDWLINYLQKQSFGIILLLFSVIAAAPGISAIGGLLLLIPAMQMIIGLPAPSFPRWIGARSIPTHRAAQILQRALPTLKLVEKAIYPRFPTPPQATKRIVGLVVMALTIRLLLVPIPFSNFIPAVIIALIALAYLEKDGAALAVSLTAGLLLILLDLSLVEKITHDVHAGL